MDWTRKTAQGFVALALAGDIIIAGIPKRPPDEQQQKQQHQQHTPASRYSIALSTGTSSAVSSGSAVFDSDAFLVYYAQPVETLTDDVSKHVPRAPVTYMVS